MGGFFYIGLGIWQFNASIFLKDVFMWGPSFIGGVFVLVGICDILSRVIILPQMLKRWNEQKVGIIGLLGLVLGLGLLFVSAFISSALFIIAAVACIVLGEGLFYVVPSLGTEGSGCDDSYCRASARLGYCY